MSQINNLILYLKELEKNGKLNLKLAERRKKQKSKWKKN